MDLSEKILKHYGLGKKTIYNNFLNEDLMDLNNKNRYKFLCEWCSRR